MPQEFASAVVLNSLTKTSMIVLQGMKSTSTNVLYFLDNPRIKMQYTIHTAVASKHVLYFLNPCMNSTLSSWNCSVYCLNEHKLEDNSI
jgi:hypothetical protein